MFRQRPVLLGIGAIVVVVLSSAAISLRPKPDPSTKITRGMTLAQVRAALGGPGEFCSEHTDSKPDGSVTKHLICHGWPFGDKILIVEFTVRKDDSGDYVPDATTGEIEWEPREQPSFLEYLPFWFGR
jgi:hypothetical protein